MTLQPVDHAAIRVNQATLLSLVVLGFILNFWPLVAFTALVLAIGTAQHQPGFKLLYTNLLQPRGWVKPEVIQDNPEPHRFAQGMAATVLALSAGLVALNVSLAGWIFAWMVVALAALNVTVGFCTGCAIYYWLNRLGVPGFAKAPVAGNFPGMKPKQQ